MSDSECNKYPVSKANQNTHICITDQKKNQCTEQFLCELIPKNLTKIVWSDYPVKIENKDTHYCSENLYGDTPCIEKEKLSQINSTSLKSGEIERTSINYKEDIGRTYINYLGANVVHDFETLISLLGCNQF